MNKGIELYNLGRFRESLRHFRSIEADEDNYTEISYFLGLNYTQLEQYDEALLYLDQVVAASDDFAQAYQARMVMGFVYATTGRYRLAEFEFQHLLDEGYDSAKVHAALGYVLYKQGNVPGSIMNLEQALEIDPDNSTALNSMAFIMADQNIRPEMARSYILKAMEMRPENPAYLDTYGWLLFKTGEIDKAESVLSRAKQLAPHDTDIHEHLYAVQKTGLTGV